MGGFVNMKENWISLRVYEKANPELCWRKSVYFSWEGGSRLLKPECFVLYKLFVHWLFPDLCISAFRFNLLK